MREILSIHVGQCGNQIAERFWRLILSEHGLGLDGRPLGGASASSVEARKNARVFFDQVTETKYVPRAVLVDLEPGVITRIESGELDDLFDQSNVIKKIPGAANNWARGFNVEGEKVIDQIMNVIDANVEKTQALQGFLLSHSVGGGAGSGLGSLIAQRLKEAYPKKKVFTFSVLPSPLISDSAIEPYNAILTLALLKRYADAVIMLDNHALFRIAARKLKRSPNYMDLNGIISLMMSSATASLRFPGSLNTDLGEILVNLVPFPGNHFLISSFAPMPTEGETSTKEEFAMIAKETFSSGNFAAAIDFDSGVFLAASVLFRGNLSLREVDEKMAEIRKSLNFASYVPTGIKIGITHTGLANLDYSGLALANHTGVAQVFDRLLGQFDIMFENNAYTHWFEGNGVSKNDLKAARDSIADLSQSYKEAE